MFTSLANYVSFLEKEGELIRIKEYCDPEFVITEITDRESKKPGGGKALLFENTGTQFPVLTNMMGSEKRILSVMGVESFEDIQKKIESLFTEFTAERGSWLEKLKLLPKLKDAAKWMPKEFKGVPPCQEIIQYQPHLSKLPILKCWPLDGGRFITLPLVHTQDPKTGIRNVGMYRMQVFSEDSTGMHWHRHKTGARHFEEFKGDRMPVAVCLGGDPVYTYAATAPLPENVDEYLLAGFLRGEGVKMAHCLTQELMVPADCDFVIEGYISPKEKKVVEGPFGDHTGFYSLEDYYPIFHITCITHRKNAIYPATVVGIPPQEDKYIAIATEKIFLSPIKLTIAPEIEDLYLPEEGVGHNFAIVKIKKRYPGHAIKIAHSLWGAGQMMFNKMIIIVDENAGNIRDHKNLAEIIKKNYIPVRDTIFSRGPLDVLDHTSPVCGYGGKLCIDATKKLEEEGLDLRSNAYLDGISFIKFIHKGDVIPIDALVVVELDKDEDLNNIYRNLWLLGGNADPIRDSSFVNNPSNLDETNKILLIDACIKKNYKGFTRPWPEIVVSSNKTKEFVDKFSF